MYTYYVQTTSHPPSPLFLGVFWNPEWDPEFHQRNEDLPGIEISDADMSDKTRWMTLLVAASIGRLYLDPDFVLSPMGTLEPIQGRNPDF